MLKKSVPWIVFFGVLLLLVFSNSSFVKVFDPFCGLFALKFSPVLQFSLLGPGGDTATALQTAM